MDRARMPSRPSSPAPTDRLPLPQDWREGYLIPVWREDTHELKGYMMDTNDPTQEQQLIGFHETVRIPAMAANADEMRRIEDAALNLRNPGNVNPLKRFYLSKHDPKSQQRVAYSVHVNRPSGKTGWLIMNHKPFMNEFDFGMEDDRNLWSLIDAPGFVLPNNPSVHRVHTFTIIDIVTQMFPPVLKAVNAWKEQLVQQRQKKQTAIKPLIDFCDVHKIVHDHILPLAHRVRMSDASGKVGLEENVWGIGLPAYYMVSPSPMRPPPSFTVITRDQALRQMHPSPHADRSALGPSYAEQIDWSRYIFKYAPSAGAS